MKIQRSTKCSLKFATQAKKKKLRLVLAEYGHVCNYFIRYFWSHQEIDHDFQIKKEIVYLPKFTWLSYRLRKVAAKEAMEMTKSVRKRWSEGELGKLTRPVHNGKTMRVCSNNARLLPSKSKEFDAWLNLNSLGHKICFKLPIKFHKHYHKLAALGKRLGGFVITENYVQVIFKIETGPKRPNHPGPDTGIDIGINALISTSNGNQYETKIKEKLNDLKRKKKGSKARKKARRAINQLIDEAVQDMFEQEDPRTVVVEKLKNVNKNTKKKKRLPKTARRLIGVWNYRYALTRIQQRSELNRVYFRTVSPFYTSVTCSSCGNVDKKQRSGEDFNCLACGHKANADLNAAINILDRCLRGDYGPPCRKP